MRTKCITSAKKNVKKTKNNQDKDLISIVLLCDSQGYRMKSYGPIPLIDIGKKKLIDIQIDAIKKRFVNFEIVVCLGCDAEKINKHIKLNYKALNIRIVENQLYNTSNSCESLRLSLNNICNDKVLICDGSLMINHDCLLTINTEKSMAVIEKNPHETLEIGLNIDKNYAEYFSFGAKNAWSEILFINGYDTIESLKKIIVNYNAKNRFIFEALNELISLNNKISIGVNSSQLIKMNNIKTYHNIKERT
jgi:hypothetical protein